MVNVGCDQFPTMSQTLTQELMFTNLVLLGLEPRRFQDKYGTSFGKDMFQNPNKKGMEVILHFLFSKIDPDQVKVDFKSCWPPFDKKSEQEFRKIASQWLVRIEKDPQSSLPKIFPSLLLSPMGERIYNLLHHLSAYCLRCVIENDFKVKGSERTVERYQAMLKKFDPKVQTSILRIVMKGAQINTIRLTEDLLSRAAHIHDKHKEWAKEADFLTDTYRNLTKKERQLEQKLKSLREKRGSREKEMYGLVDVRESLRNTPEGSSAHVMRKEKIRQLRCYWDKIQKVMKETKFQRQLLADIIQGSKKKHILRGDDFAVSVSNAVFKVCEKEMRLGYLSDPYSQGVLNIEQLLRMFNLCLNDLVGQFRTMSAGSAIKHCDDVLSFIKTKAEFQKTYSTNINALNESAKIALCEVMSKVNMQKENLLMQYKSRASSSHNSPSLKPIPPTPLASFTPSSMTKTTFVGSKKISRIRDLASDSPREDGLTPFEVQRLQTSIKNAVDEKQLGLAKRILHFNNSEKGELKPSAKGVKSSRIPRSANFTPKLSRNVTSKKNVKKESKSKPVDNPIGPSKTMNEPGVNVLDRLAEDVASNVVYKHETMNVNETLNGSAYGEEFTQALFDPLSAIDSEAFRSKDLLGRTPEKPSKASVDSSSSGNSSSNASFNGKPALSPVQELNEQPVEQSSGSRKKSTPSFSASRSRKEESPSTAEAQESPSQFRPLSQEVKNEKHTSDPGRSASTEVIGEGQDISEPTRSATKETNGTSKDIMDLKKKLFNICAKRESDPSAGDCDKVEGEVEKAEGGVEDKSTGRVQSEKSPTGLEKIRSRLTSALGPPSQTENVKSKSETSSASVDMNVKKSICDTPGISNLKSRLSKLKSAPSDAPTENNTPLRKTTVESKIASLSDEKYKDSPSRQSIIKAKENMSDLKEKLKFFRKRVKASDVREITPKKEPNSPPTQSEAPLLDLKNETSATADIESIGLQGASSPSLSPILASVGAPSTSSFDIETTFGNNSQSFNFLGGEEFPSPLSSSKYNPSFYEDTPEEGGVDPTSQQSGLGSEDKENENMLVDLLAQTSVKPSNGKGKTLLPTGVPAGESDQFEAPKANDFPLQEKLIDF
eukprot:Nk52_evm4s539 gene=Nk52_evmTU4s539